MKLAVPKTPSPAGLLIIGTLFLNSPGPAETYDSWTALHFTAPEIAAGMASPLCDHDLDDCPNIFEYFGNSLPKDRDSSFLKTFSTDEVSGEITVSFPAGINRNDVNHIVLVSNDLINWTDDAVYVCNNGDLTYHLNGYQYVKIGVMPKPGIFIDTDGDGLLDYFEESLITSNPGDAFDSLADILPNDDFDNNGTLNIDEPENAVSTGSFTKPATISPIAVACAVEDFPANNPPALLVHTKLQ